MGKRTQINSECNNISGQYNIYIFLNIWLPFPILLSFSYHPKMMRSSYLELFCYVMQINLLFLIYGSNPSGSITPHKWFNYFLESKDWARASRLLERALSLRSSSINSLLGGPWRVFCQLHIFAYPRQVTLSKVFVDARLQRPRGSTFGRETGKIIAEKAFKK